jgi:hypothetical protein
LIPYQNTLSPSSIYKQVSALGVGTLHAQHACPPSPPSESSSVKNEIDRNQAGVSPVSGLLGIYAKSCPQNIPSLPSDASVYRRLQRFALQSQIAKYLPDERVKTCLRNPIGDHVTVKHNTVKDSYGYRNLETCASVWMCPVCAAKISEKRRVELSSGINVWQDRQGVVAMMTITIQHNLMTPFKQTLSELQAAYRSLLKCKIGKQTLENMGVVGRIRALETTYGENGWHPHFHVLLFLKSKIDLQLYQSLLLNEWKRVCKRQGMKTPNEHGLKLNDGAYAAAYVSKWGIESEMTKGHIKKSKSGYSPFDLARFDLGIYTGEAKPLLPGQARMLFREYAFSMKGKRQLVWSDGLRDLLGLRPEKSDKELIDETEDQEILFVRIPFKMWKVILKAERRGEVLEACKQGLNYFYAYCKSIWLQYGEVNAT